MLAATEPFTRFTYCGTADTAPFKASCFSCAPKQHARGSGANISCCTMKCLV